ncbi:hypothetical protein [Solimonas sp. SE-A11]|uniref:hypothetical protein n=1 Tax=Solimonas sp. SE-A11 TaxID=3054954 RepID=UPI00259C7274|nr:hypothetical protein [Solimonas sp. SE-A11]MDM4772351.1 hypothetical protein [Solimonas sp. SE-A11]
MEHITFQSTKLVIMSATGLDRDALHVYAGLATLFISALIFRKPLRSWLPWLLVLAVAIIVELVDLRNDWVTRHRLQWGASLHDIWNTLFWPSVILLLARRTRLFGARTGAEK